jgi:O-antigen/teichoic acid export membrane protein
MGGGRLRHHPPTVSGHPEPPVATAAQGQASEQARQLRGSSLLLTGRVLALGLGFLSQVLVVRYLPKADFGAFAYALSLVALGEAVVTLGLDRADTRFISIYDERRDYARFFGTIVMELITVACLGAALVLLVHGLQGWLAGTLISSQKAISLLLILIALSPLQALDRLLMSLFAVLSNPRAIFFRTYVLAPGLRLAVVLLLIASHSPVWFLAAGYVVTGAAGTLLYSALLVRLLRARGILAHFNLRRLKLPVAAVFGFALPLLTTDLVYVVMHTFDTLLLGRYHDTTEVAAFRVVLPVANLNTVVFQSFTLLFVPLAARLFERGDREGLQDLYWTTAIWLAVISFPVFMVTSVLAQPVAVLLFGTRYADSGTYLALLSVGYYFQAALGFNGLTIQVFGKIRYSVVVNVLAAAYNAAINWVLIPRHGALGAAIGTGSALIVHNLLKQAGLRLGTGITVFDWRYLRVYAVIAGCAVAFGLVEALLSPPFLVGLALAGVASAVVLAANRAMLRVGAVFPEILRVPLLRRIVGG